MESQIFKFLKWPIQLKLIASMGRGIYGLFHQRLIFKVLYRFLGFLHPIFKAKRLQNLKGNYLLVLTKSKVQISWDRIKFMTCDWFGIDTEWKYIFAKKGFVISEGLSRKDNFTGTIVYYFEVTQSAPKWSVIFQSKKKMKIYDFFKQGILRGPLKWSYSPC
jgi:hypothetical protein